jgi:hypothetical protein
MKISSITLPATFAARPSCACVAPAAGTIGLSCCWVLFGSVAFTGVSPIKNQHSPSLTRLSYNFKSIFSLSVQCDFKIEFYSHIKSQELVHCIYILYVSVDTGILLESCHRTCHNTLKSFCYS